MLILNLYLSNLKFQNYMIFTDFKLVSLCFFSKKGFLPDAFKEMFLLTSHIPRYNTRHCNSFSLFSCRTTIRQFTISSQGPKLFNSFKSEIQNAESISLF